MKIFLMILACCAVYAFFGGITHHILVLYENSDACNFVDDELHSLQVTFWPVTFVVYLCKFLFYIFPGWLVKNGAKILIAIKYTFDAWIEIKKDEK